MTTTTVIGVAAGFALAGMVGWLGYLAWTGALDETPAVEPLPSGAYAGGGWRDG